MTPLIVPVDTEYKDSYQGWGCSSVGGRDENQDTPSEFDTPLGLVVAVCDGMGGGPGGKQASLLAVNALEASMKDLPEDTDPVEAVTQAIHAADKAIKDFAAADRRYESMGSTVVMALLSPDCVTVGHIGDSRFYLLRGREVIYRTSDHSLVMQQVREGRIRSEEDARKSPSSNIITQALGHGSRLKPDVVSLPYKKGDRMVLCSDGIWGMFPQKELIKMISGVATAEGAIDKVVVNVEEEGRRQGGHHDNLTIIIVEPKIDSIMKQKMNKRLKTVFWALSVICLLSLALNIVLLARGRGGEHPEKEHPEQVKEAGTQSSGIAASLEKELGAADMAEAPASEASVESAAAPRHVDTPKSQKKESPAAEVSAEDELQATLRGIIQKLEEIKSIEPGEARNRDINDCVAQLQHVIDRQLDKNNVSIKEALEELRKPIARSSDKKRSEGQIQAVIKKLEKAASPKKKMTYY